MSHSCDDCTYHHYPFCSRREAGLRCVNDSYQEKEREKVMKEYTEFIVEEVTEATETSRESIELICTGQRYTKNAEECITLVRCELASRTELGFDWADPDTDYNLTAARVATLRIRCNMPFRS